MMSLVARLALRGPLLAFDAGDQLDVFQMARLIRKRARDSERVLGRVRVARAFTAYQVVALLQRLPATPMTHVIFDLPAYFHDERLPAAESAHLLRVALRHVERLRREAPILISVRRPARPGHRAGLLQAVNDLADHVFVWEDAAANSPVRLF